MDTLSCPRVVISVSIPYISSRGCLRVLFINMIVEKTAVVATFQGSISILSDSNPMIVFPPVSGA